MSVFVRERRIRFSDCDPAGIVFYPQYFVMFNGLVEDWVNEGLGLSYHGLVAERRVGLPTVHLDADFKAVSPLGDLVALQLQAQLKTALGRPGWSPTARAHLDDSLATLGEALKATLSKQGV